MRKLSLVLFLSLALILTACASKEDSISTEDLDKYGEISRNVIGYLNEGETEKIYEISTADLKAALTDEVLIEVYSTIDGLGDFVDFGDSDGIYQVDKNTDEKYTVILQKAKYEEKELLFTVNFNSEGQLAGIFYK